jgi:hypothetical protein
MLTSFFDSLGSHSSTSRPALWANRFLVLGILLFAGSIPHSIAAAHISLDIALLAWIVRDIATRRLQFKSTTIDKPLIAFAIFSVLSAIFSFEPGLSGRKLLPLLLFGVVYLLVSNLNRKGSKIIAALILVSGLVGVLYSLGEKVIGRGIVITSIDSAGPLSASELRPGDILWMLNRDAVHSLDDVREKVRSHRAGDRIEIEAIRRGDPLSLTFEVTEKMLEHENPLGLELGERNRRFRVSGFTRHFLTFADQMSILASICAGMLLASLMKRQISWLWLALTGAFFLALMLTATRAAVAAFLLSVVVTTIVAGGRRVLAWALAIVALLGVATAFVLITSRTPEALRLRDDSTSRRIAYMQAGLRMIPKHPILGVGIDSHKLHWKEWGFPGEYITHTHSTPIQIAMDRGLPALACLIWLFAVMIRTALRQARRESDARGLALGVFSALVGFVLVSFVNYNFGDSEVLLMLLAWFGLFLVRSALSPKATNSIAGGNATGLAPRSSARSLAQGVSPGNTRTKTVSPERATEGPRISAARSGLEHLVTINLALTRQAKILLPLRGSRMSKLESRWQRHRLASNEPFRP